MFVLAYTLGLFVGAGAIALFAGSRINRLEEDLSRLRKRALEEQWPEK